MGQQLKTAEEVRVDFERRGINVTQWARDRGLTRQAVFAVLGGKTKGKRGDAHKAAVLLGIKDGVIDAENEQQ
ncbi:DNA-binding protein [Aromatoleum toluvorans]|uniref:DNA-binding protein n=1 Tax=Aromatoleum toluvorans TaxID=92002 RepID=A0ABX1Q2K6_9RHOO|nr:DNA-binding protein [Aromatoleum toluvorans]NMG45946.1 DNA-binding protein [Aromatoleum toluvorans]